MMYVMAVVTNAGIERLAVSQSKRALKLWRSRIWDTDGFTCWRLHDGSGWCDGSENAWQAINMIVGKKAEIVI
jgi:hypothetical protein